MSFLRHWPFFASVALACAVGVWLHWPSVDSGFRGDDYVQAAMLRGDFSVERSRFDLFDFASGERADTAALRDFGYLPWWSVQDLRLRMWRPLASALMAADYAVFGEHARPQHLHSLAWLVAMLLSAALLLRALLPESIAALACVFFAMEEGHAVPVAWLANRSTLVATTFAFLACAAHVRVRQSAASTHVSRMARVAFVALLTSLALLSGEYSFTALTYVLAYELLVAQGAASERVRASLPVLVPTLVYLLLHATLGRDVVGSGYYISPISSPVSFAMAALVRVPVLVADLVLGFPAAYYNMGSPFRSYVLSHHWFSPSAWRSLPDWTTGHAFIGWAALLGYLWLLRTLLRALPQEQRPALRCLGLGMLLALAPSASALPGGRLVGGAALGVCAVGATLLMQLSPLARGVPWLGRVGRSCLALWVLWVLGLQSVAQARGQSSWFAHESDALRVWSLDADLPVTNAAAQRIYVVATADFTTSVNLPWLRLMHGLPLSRSYRRLMPGSEPFDLRRLDAHTLEITVLTGDVRGDAVPSLYRDDNHPMVDGMRAQLPGLSVQVMRTLLGNPFVVRFRFDEDLDDEHMWFLQCTAEGLRRIHMPKVGEVLRLPKAQLRDLRVLGRSPPGADPE